MYVIVDICFLISVIRLYSELCLTVMAFRPKFSPRRQDTGYCFTLRWIGCSTGLAVLNVLRCERTDRDSEQIVVVGRQRSRECDQSARWLSVIDGRTETARWRLTWSRRNDFRLLLQLLLPTFCCFLHSRHRLQVVESSDRWSQWLAKISFGTVCLYVHRAWLAVQTSRLAKDRVRSNMSL